MEQLSEGVEERDSVQLSNLSQTDALLEDSSTGRSLIIDTTQSVGDLVDIDTVRQVVADAPDLSDKQWRVVDLAVSHPTVSLHVAAVECGVTATFVYRVLSRLDDD